LIITFGITFLNALILPLITLPGHIYLLVFTGFAFIFPMTAQNLFLTSVMPDICDLDELEHGERREGLFSAVKSFVDKVEISLCTLLGMFVLWFIGFDARQPTQPDSVLKAMLWWAFVPKIIFSGLAFALAFRVPITEEVMTRVRMQIEERRRSAASNVKIDTAAEAELKAQ
jgi:GPH family glycoside/pentoside/hexuronide:cation symporter